jgi:hypothetical protein
MASILWQRIEKEILDADDPRWDVIFDLTNQGLTHNWCCSGHKVDFLEFILEELSDLFVLALVKYEVQEPVRTAAWVADVRCEVARQIQEMVINVAEAKVVAIPISSGPMAEA